MRLPPEEVVEQYRHAQNEILGKRPRSLKRDTLAVFEFVNQRKGRSWREVFEAWNEEHPPHQRFKDRSHLYTTYDRAIKNLAAIKPAKTAKGPKVAGTNPAGTPVIIWDVRHDRASQEVSRCDD